VRGIRTVVNDLPGTEKALDEDAVSPAEAPADLEPPAAQSPEPRATGLDGSAVDTSGANGSTEGLSDADPVATALEILLANHPEAVFYAIDSNAHTVDMPGSVDLKGHELMEGNNTALEMVVPGNRGVVIETWEKLLNAGIASAHVRLAADPDRTVMLHFLDAREEHGVVIGALTTAEQTAEAAVIEHAIESRAPRFARVRKDGLAVLLEVDEAFTEILGWTPEEIVGCRTRDLVHPDDEALAVDNWMDMLAASGPGRRVRLRHRHRDGNYVWMEVTNHNFLEDPDYRCVVAEMVDISEEMATQEALRAREQLLDRLAQTLPLGLLQVDVDSEVIYTNDRLHSIVGTPRAGTVSEQLASVIDDDREVVEEAFAGVLQGGVDSDIEVRLRPYGASDKEIRYCTLNLRALTDSYGAVNGAIVCVTDVTESARARDELRARATYDAVTRCFNRASTIAELEAMLASEGSDRRPAVIYVDLDRFKEVNDSLGHQAGDDFLRVVAERLHRCVRSEDVVGRIGGDEFLVICPRISNPQEAMSTAARLASSLKNQITLKKAGVPSSASIGVAWSDGKQVSAETLVSQADTAMYQSKHAGYGEPVLFQESMVGAENSGTWQWPSLPDDPN
jgi:diguanylate cyclase (GGDEF)-like protein/PAS domain S-box-containing protein